MAETPNVCPALHMPMQSGSDRVLRAMRRSYRSERFLSILDKVRAAIPHAAITTDMIVGFPGETEQDFQDTLDVVAAARFSARVHVPVLQAARHPGRRTGRPAAESRCAGTLSAADRAAGADLAGGEHRADRHAPSSCWWPRERDARTPAPRGCPGGPATAGWCTSRPTGADIRPGDIVTTTVTDAAPHHLIADGTVLHHRRTRAGDAHARAGHAATRVSAWACPASACQRASRPRPDVPGDRRRQPKRRLRRVQGRYRGRRTPRRAGNRPRRKGVGHRHRACSCCC